MNKFFRTLIILIILVGIIALAVFGTLAEVKSANAHWNNGVCENCGGEYKFSSAVHIRNSGDYYYYTCEDCGHTIKTHDIMK